MFTAPDTVQSSVTFTLGDNVENLTLTGRAAINAKGNVLANILIGNGAANILNGGIGADILQGGAGNDTYIVENILDQAIETSSTHGVDLVSASVSFTLAAKLENLTLTGAGSINGTGNGAGNSIIGNSGANTLKGEGGDDIITGGGGADQIHGGSGNDDLAGGAGADGFRFDMALSAATKRRRYSRLQRRRRHNLPRPRHLHRHRRRWQARRLRLPGGRQRPRCQRSHRLRRGDGAHLL